MNTNVDENLSERRRQVWYKEDDKNINRRCNYKRTRRGEWTDNDKIRDTAHNGTSIKQW